MSADDLSPLDRLEEGDFAGFDKAIESLSLVADDIVPLIPTNETPEANAREIATRAPGWAIELSDEVDPWEMQDNETAQGYALFCKFREIAAPVRSVAEFGRQLAPDNPTNQNRVRTIAKRFRWIERSMAYDAAQERIYRAVQEKDRKEMAIRQIKIAKHLQEIIAQRVDNLDPSEISTRDIAPLLKTAAEIERAARTDLVGTPDIRSQVQAMIKADKSLNESDEDDIMREVEKYLKAIRKP